MVHPPATGEVPHPEASLTHQTYLARKYFPELDGLRALSVLIVISVHMKDRIWDWLQGRLGVTIFFVLSGYLITRLALTEERDTGTLNKRAFFVRRSFRLLPIYYFVLAVYCVLIFGLKMSPEKVGPFQVALPYYLTYLQEWPFFRGVGGSVLNIPFYQTWTLGIEEKFYFVWPFVGFVLWRRRPATRRFGTAALTVFLALAPALFGEAIGRFLYSYSQILIGCLIALLLDDPALYHRIDAAFRRRSVQIPVLLALVALHFVGPYLPDTLSWVHINAYAAATGLALVVLLLNEGPLQRFLRLGPLLLVGRLSYGIYLVHLLALNAAEKIARPGTGNPLVSTAALILAWIISGVLAYALAVAIERPSIAAGRRLSRALIHRSDAARHAPAVVAKP